AVALGQPSHVVTGEAVGLLFPDDGFRVATDSGPAAEIGLDRVPVLVCQYGSDRHRPEFLVQHRQQLRAVPGDDIRRRAVEGVHRYVGGGAAADVERAAVGVIGKVGADRLDLRVELFGEDAGPVIHHVRDGSGGDVVGLAVGYVAYAHVRSGGIVPQATREVRDGEPRHFARGVWAPGLEARGTEQGHAGK